MEQDGLFAHVNDAIRRLAMDDATTQTCEFLCECTDIACHAFVSLTPIEFDERRAASPPVAILATDHEG